VNSARIPVLVVDDEAPMLELLHDYLREWGFEPRLARNRVEAMAQLQTHEVPIVLTDMRLPDMDGLEFVSVVRAHAPRIEVVLMTGYYSVDSAVAAIRNGAFDYLCKPFPLERLKETMEKLRHRLKLDSEAESLEAERLEKADFHGIVGRSPVMYEVFDLLERVAFHFGTVLISGETGTGKELVARVLHRLSPVADKPFVVCNCSALVPTLVESQLFGHVRGAFTGATESRPGLFEVADGGTVFLDEVSEMTPPMQARLLRVLQSGEVQRVGTTSVRKVKVRVVTATNRDLTAEVQAGRFREDLLYRLKVIEIHLPPLRERGEDVLLLARHFVRQFAQRFGKPIAGLTRTAQAAILRYPWPGNVRELEHALERACMLCPSTQIRLEDLPPNLSEAGVNRSASNAELPLMSFEEAQRRLLAAALKETGGNRSQTAAILGVSRPTLYRLLDKFGFSGNRSAKVKGAAVVDAEDSTAGLFDSDEEKGSRVA